MTDSRSLIVCLGLATAASAQVEWTRHPTPISPGERHGHAMAFDQARGTTVLFGGSHGPVTFADTWTFDGRTWTQRGVAGPAARTNHTMVYDPSRRVVVLFGGLVPGVGPTSETWEWDGVRWTLRSPATSPPPRSHAAGAPWPQLGGIVVHGGYPLGGPRFWLWNGTSWRDLTTPATPDDAGHAIAYHPGQGCLLVLGPNAQQRWDGREWLPSEGAGPVRWGARLVYDGVRDRIVSFGGRSPSSAYDYAEETWVWDGLGARLDRPMQPGGREQFDMVFDTNLGSVVMFGGFRASFVGSWSYDDTQVLRTTTRPAPYVEPRLRGFGFTSGCAYVGDGVFSRTAKPLLTAAGEHAWVDETFTLGCHGAGGTFAPIPVSLAYGLSDRVWNGVPLPLRLAALGRPDCTLLVAPLIALPATAKYSAHWPIRIPNVAALAGTTHYFQVLGVSPLGGLFTTDGVEIAIGHR